MIQAEPPLLVVQWVARQQMVCGLIAQHKVALLVLLVLMLRLVDSFGLDSCDSSRPGGGAARAHRVLRVPARFGPWDAEDRVAAAQLCCVYTRVAIDDTGSLASAVLDTYDLSSITLAAADFQAAAQDSLDRICRMSMGQVDCRSGQTCMANASAYHNTSGLEPSHATDSAAPGLMLVLPSWAVLRSTYA